MGLMYAKDPECALRLTFRMNGKHTIEENLLVGRDEVECSPPLMIPHGCDLRSVLDERSGYVAGCSFNCLHFRQSVYTYIPYATL